MTCTICRDFRKFLMKKSAIITPVEGKKVKEVKVLDVKNNKPIMAIDFDGVIHDAQNPVKGRRMGAPMPGAKEAVEELAKRYSIFIFCVWANDLQGIQTIRDWLDFYEISYNTVTNIKPPARFYIDDNALRFIDWQQTLEALTFYEKQKYGDQD